MTKQADARVKLSLERERLALKNKRLQLEQEARGLTRLREQILKERAEALPFLRLICQRFGNNEWADDTPLTEILDRHLLAPLRDHEAEQQARHNVLQDTIKRLLPAGERPAQLRPTASSAPTRPPLRQAPPAPVRAASLGPPPTVARAHSTMTVRAQDGSLVGYRSLCICGWRSVVRRTEADANEAGRLHCGTDQVPIEQVRRVAAN